MKRIILMCMVIMLVLSGIANAEIKKEKNNTGVIISSALEDENGLKAEFVKTIIKNEVFYNLTLLTKSNYPTFLVDNKPLELDIDKYPTIYFDKYHYKKYGKTISCINVEITADIVQKISVAQKALLSCTPQETSEYWGILFAPDFLSEWKQVINTTE